MAGHPATAEDLTQDTFVNAWRSLPGYEGRSRFSTWLLTWGLMRDPMAMPTPVNYGPNSALGAVQLMARDELLVQFRQRLNETPPETRETVVKNLAIIQRAADEIDAALAQDPASGLLNGLLLSTYQEELQIYSKVVTSGDTLTRRT